MAAGGDVFSLEEHLDHWRSEMSGHDISADELDELQSHLEDSFNELLTKGFPEHEAWLLAMHRMGPGKVIKEEFRTAKGWKTPNKILNILISFFILYSIAMLGMGNYGDWYNTGHIRISRFILLIALIVLMIYRNFQDKKLRSFTILKLLSAAIGIYLFVIIFGFLTSYESPVCRNENPVFANKDPQSQVYQQELIKHFARYGTDNLYYLYNYYFSRNGQDYIMVKAVGNGFCASFPVNFTASKKWRFIRTTKGDDHFDCQLVGLKFDLISLRNGKSEFIFRDMERIAD